MAPILRYDGVPFLRHRLMMSTLSGKPVRIDNIRTDEEEIGLRGKKRRSFGNP